MKFETVALLVGVTLILASLFALMVGAPEWLMWTFLWGGFLSIVPLLISDMRRDLELLATYRRALGGPRFWLLIAAVMIVIAAIVIVTID